MALTKKIKFFNPSPIKFKNTQSLLETVKLNKRHSELMNSTHKLFTNPNKVNHFIKWWPTSLKNMFSDSEIKKHNSPADAWVKFKGKILDITEFLPSHPGSQDILLPYLGADITEAFKAADHSVKAENMIENMIVGTTAKQTSKIDPYKGTVYQVWTKLDLDSYTEFVNNPTSLMGHMRVFDNPFLEIFSQTPWQLIPSVWLPVITYYLYTSYLDIGLQAFMMFFVGIVYWTLFEYFMHRFLFHSEQYLPNNRHFITFHYLMHGVHHAFPMDSLRLVFPPVLGIILATITKTIYNFAFPASVAHGFFAGKILGYVWYDLFHYFSHHAESKTGYFAFMKSYHLAHHYKNPFKGFGVSNHFWDLVFGTELTLSNKSPRLG